MVDRQPLTHLFFFVVSSLGQGLTGHIVFSRLARGAILIVIDTTRGSVHTATTETTDNLLIVDINLNHIVDFYSRLFQRFGLRNCSREAVEQKALFAVGRLRSEEHTSELQSRGHLVC